MAQTQQVATEAAATSVRQVRRAEETVDWSQVEEDSMFLQEAVMRARQEMAAAEEEREKPHRKPHNFGELPDVAIEPEEVPDLEPAEAVQIMLFGSCLPEKVLNDPAIADKYLRPNRKDLVN